MQGNQNKSETKREKNLESVFTKETDGRIDVIIAPPKGVTPYVVTIVVTKRQLCEPFLDFLKCM